MAIKKSELYSWLWSSCDELRGGMDAGFAAMVALKGKSDIDDQINKKVITPVATAKQQLSQSDFPGFNDPVKLGDGKGKIERLTILVAIFEGKALDFSKNRADGDDIFGDAYKYLMRQPGGGVS